MQLYGLPGLMPWQRELLEVATEYDPETGKPFYSEVFVTLPRQQGKTTIVLGMQLERCLGWGEQQFCVWTGQNGNAIRKKWLNEIVPQLERSKLRPLIGKVNKANGNEGIEFVTTSRIDLLSSSEDSGHGMVLDLAVLDEIWKDTDNRREAGLSPAMATRIPGAQTLLCSTAGNAASFFYNRKVRAGRRAVAEDRGVGTCYVEYSADDDWDPDDEESWWGHMPALGITVHPSFVREERIKMAETPGEFERAYGNRPALEGGEVIPDGVWKRVTGSYSASPDGRIGIGVDVAPARDVAAVALSDGSVVELVAYDPGVSWVVARVRELSDRYGAPVFFDAAGPAAQLAGLADLPRAQPQKSPEVFEACATFFDDVADGRIRVRSDAPLDSAVAGVVKKTAGDRWSWSRRTSRRDVSPLYAATFAWAAATTEPEPTKTGFAFVMGDR
jgi:hypothetical protein